MPVPPTVQAILASRLDALSPDERAVLERASVIGERFYWSAIEDLAPEALRSSVGGALMTLVRRDLIRPAASDLGHEEAFGFRHALIRDAAYAGIPKELRANFHEAFADWLSMRVGDDAAGYEEIVGYHLEQAYRNLAELGPPDERARALGSRAAELLAAAGFRAWDRADDTAMRNLLRRADALLSADDPRRVRLLLHLGGTIVAVAEEVLLEEALRIAELCDDEAGVAVARSGSRDREALGRARFADVGGGRARGGGRGVCPRGNRRPSRPRERAALARVAGGGPRAARPRVPLVRPRPSGRGRRRPAARGVDRHRDGRRHLDPRGNTDIGGRTPAPRDARASGRRPPDRARDSWRLGLLLARTGNTGEGRELVDRAKAWADDLGYDDLGPFVDGWAATWLDPWVLDAATWERNLRAEMAAQADLGDRREWDLTPQLAVALCLLGRFADAERLTSETVNLDDRFDIDLAVAWRGARARALARLGQPDEAERLASEAVALTERSSTGSTSAARRSGTKPTCSVGLAATRRPTPRSEPGSRCSSGRATRLLPRSCGPCSRGRSRPQTRPATSIALMRRLVAVLALVLAAPSCGGGTDTPPPSATVASPSPSASATGTASPSPSMSSSPSASPSPTVRPTLQLPTDAPTELSDPEGVARSSPAT